MSDFLHRAEYGAARLVLGVMRRLPPGWASTLGGFVARRIGPFLPSSRIAAINLTLAMPALTKAQRRQIIRECWENLGRTLAEFPHLGALKQDTPSGPGWRVEGDAHLLQARQSGRPVVFFSGHIGNWELMPAIVARYGLAFASFYRAPNNAAVDRLLRSLRCEAVGQEVPLFPKGAKGARSALHHLARGGHLGVLGDQKMNDGIETRFFGRPSMTAPAAAALALRYKALIVTGHVRREGPARLVLHVDPPLDFVPGPDRQADITEVTQRLNDRLQRWIEERPGSWLWLHRRWDKALYRKR